MQYFFIDTSENSEREQPADYQSVICEVSLSKAFHYWNYDTHDIQKHSAPLQLSFLDAVEKTAPHVMQGLTASEQVWSEDIWHSC